MGARLSAGRVGLLAAGALAATLTSCGAHSRPNPLAGVPRALVLQARPMGRGPRFQPPATGPVIGRCRNHLGRRFGVHVEVFAANRVVLVAEGIGTRPPRRYSAGRISGAACYGDVVTVDPTGLVLVRPGLRVTLAALFRSWGQPLSPHRLTSFASRQPVEVFVDGRRWTGPVNGVRLARHAEIVLEVGPHVPPHAWYGFPPGT